MGEDRAANVKTIAARIAAQAEGLSVREFLDACALASATLIRAIYRGPGVAIATERYNEAFHRALNK
jgi:hypothetical protein